MLHSKVVGCCYMEILGAGYWDGDFGGGLFYDGLLWTGLIGLSLVGGGWTEV